METEYLARLGARIACGGGFCAVLLSWWYSVNIVYTFARPVRCSTLYVLDGAGITAQVHLRFTFGEIV